MNHLEPAVADLTSEFEAGDERLIMEAIWLSISADGEVHPAEQTLERMIAKALWPRASEEELNEHFTESLHSRQQLGTWKQALVSVAERLKDRALSSRQAALGLAALVQYVDGDLADEEEDLANLLAHALGLPLPLAQTVIDRVEGHLEALQPDRTGGASGANP